MIKNTARKKSFLLKAWASQRKAEEEAFGGLHRCELMFHRCDEVSAAIRKAGRKDGQTGGGGGGKEGGKEARERELGPVCRDAEPSYQMAKSEGAWALL